MAHYPTAFFSARPGHRQSCEPSQKCSWAASRKSTSRFPIRTSLSPFSGRHTLGPGLFPSELFLGRPSFCVHQATLAGLGPATAKGDALLLRHCASLVQQPRNLQSAAVLQCLEACCSGHLLQQLTPKPSQATLSTKCGGLGLRSVCRHSGEACTASTLCALLFRAWTPSSPTSTRPCYPLTMFLSHRRRPFDNKICLGFWTGARCSWSALAGTRNEVARAHRSLERERGSALPRAA